MNTKKECIQLAIETTIEKLSDSTFARYIEKVYLHNNHPHKVNLMIEFTPEFLYERYEQEISKVKKEINIHNQNFPEVNLNIVLGLQWRNSEYLYYKNIQHHGVNIWEKMA